MPAATQTPEPAEETDETRCHNCGDFYWLCREDGSCPGDFVDDPDPEPVERVCRACGWGLPDCACPDEPAPAGVAVERARADAAEATVQRVRGVLGEGSQSASTYVRASDLRRALVGDQ